MGKLTEWRLRKQKISKKSLEKSGKEKKRDDRKKMVFRAAAMDAEEVKNCEAHGMEVNEAKDEREKVWKSAMNRMKENG